MCYYLYDNILIDEKSHEHTLMYNILRKSIDGTKVLRIRFNQIDRVIRV